MFFSKYEGRITSGLLFIYVARKIETAPQKNTNSNCDIIYTNENKGILKKKTDRDLGELPDT